MNKEKKKQVLVSSCISMLRYSHYLTWRNISGSVRDKTGNTTVYSKLGSGDIFAVKDGKFINIYVTKKLDFNQMSFAQEVIKAGGLVWVIKNIDELMDCMDGKTEKEVDYDQFD